MLRDAALQLVDARAGLRRGDKDLLGGQFQLLADACQLAGLLGAAELVRFGECYYKVELVLTQVIDHLKVELAGIVANVDQRDHQVEAALGLKKIADKDGPAVALCLGALGEAVAGQVYKVDAVRLEKVDVGGLAGGA